MPSLKWKNAIGNPQVVETSYLKHGNIEITDELELISWRILHELPTDSGFIGAVSYRELNVELSNPTGKKYMDERLEVFAGKVYEDSTSEHISMGTFIIVEETYNDVSKISSLKGFDLLYTLDQVFVEFEIPVGMTFRQYITVLLNKVGLVLSNKPFNMDSSVVTHHVPMDSDGTYRMALSTLAQVGMNGIRLDGNEVELTPLKNTENLVEIDDYFEITIGKGIEPVNTIVLARMPQNDRTYFPETIEGDRSELEIVNNTYVDLQQEIYAPMMLLYSQGFEYVPFEIEMLNGYPDLKAFTHINFKDIDYVEYKSIITWVEHSFTGNFGTKIKCTIEPLAEIKYERAGSVAQRIKRTELWVDKTEQEIVAIIQDTEDLDGRYTQMKLDLDGFKVSTNESFTTVESMIENIELTPGPKGEDGVKGEDGRGIANTVITYKAHTSGTSVPPNTEWSPNPPVVGSGEYLWSRTTINYTSGSPSVSYSIGLMGEQGPKGQDGAKGEDGKDGATGRGIANTVVTYQVGSSGNNVPTGTWSSTIPSVPEGQYLWTKVYTTYTDNVNPTTAYSVGKMGEQGNDGPRGIPGEDGKDGSPTYNWVGYSTHADGRGVSGNPTGKDYVGYAIGKSSPTPNYVTSEFSTPFQLVKGAQGVKGETGIGVDTTTVNYTTSVSGTSVPTGGWGTAVPSVSSGEYLWTRTTIKYTGPINDTVSYSVGLMGEQGPKGDTVVGPKGEDGRGITNTVIRYQASFNGKTVPTGSWLVDIPTVLDNQYLWTRTVISYSDNTSSTSYSIGKVGKQGVKGDTGASGRDNYTWVMYADNKTPTSAQMTTNPTGKKFIGFAYNKETGTPSKIHTDYEWSLSPEYFDSELNIVKTTQTNQGTEISDNSTAITLRATKEEVTTIETRVDGELSDLSTETQSNSADIIVQSERIDQEIIDRKDYVDGSAREVTNALTETINGFDRTYTNRFESVEGDIEEFESVFRYDAPSNTIHLGKSDNDIEMKLSNDKLQFISNQTGQYSEFTHSGMYNQQWLNDQHLIKSFNENGITGTIWVDKGSDI